MYVQYGYLYFLLIRPKLSVHSAVQAQNLPLFLTPSIGVYVLTGSLGVDRWLDYRLYKLVDKSANW